MTTHACGFDPRNDCAACEAEERQHEQGVVMTLDASHAERVLGEVMADVLARDIPEAEKPGQILFEFAGRGFTVHADERWDHLATLVEPEPEEDR